MLVQQVSILEQLLHAVGTDPVPDQYADPKTIKVIKLHRTMPGYIEASLPIKHHTFAYALHRNGENVCLWGYVTEGRNWVTSSTLNQGDYDELLNKYRELRRFNFGSPYPATALLLVDHTSKQLYVVDRAWFEREIDSILPGALAALPATPTAPE